jgi:hypothetical protein
VAKRGISKAYRQRRWDKATEYLRQYPTWEQAREAARQDGVSFDGSVWLSAFSKMLERGEFPGKPGNR